MTAVASNARRHARTRVLRACAALAGVLLLDAAVADAVIRWDSVGPPGRRALLPADASGLRDLGSQVGSVAVDPADGRRVYAATSDGLFVSSNGGESWTFADAGAATPAHL